MSHVLTDAHSFWHHHAPSAAHARRRNTSTGPPLAAGERTLRRFETATEHLVATDRALYRQGAASQWLRVAWADIALVGWSKTECALSLRLWPGGTGDEIRIPGDASLAAFADERVNATQLLVTHAEIRPGVIATVTAVRSPEDDPVRWWVLVGDHDAARDPEFREVCERVVAELRGLTGC